MQKKQKYKPQLKRISLSDEAFEKVLTNYDFYEKVDDIFQYVYGYQDRYIIRYTENYLICTEDILYYLGLLPEDIQEDIHARKEVRLWYQYFCIRNWEQMQESYAVSSPAASCKRINRILHKEYTDEEIVDIFHDHEADDSSIIHVSAHTEPGKILRFDNCYYYDANGAYASELIKMFPKCKKAFTAKFIHRHDNHNMGKNDFNYFVGCLTQNEEKRQEQIANGQTPRVIYPKTRHYIVNNVSKMLIDLKRRLDPEQVLYANTDGIIVRNPKRVLPSEEAVGTFKIENSGTIYTYAGRNYSIIQFADTGEIKGSLPVALRDKVNLMEGRVVEYDRVLTDMGIYTYKNVREVIINENS